MYISVDTLLKLDVCFINMKSYFISDVSTIIFVKSPFFSYRNIIRVGQDHTVRTISYRNCSIALAMFVYICVNGNVSME